MRRLLPLAILVVVTAPVAADDETIPPHTTLTPGFGGGWLHARDRYGSGMAIEVKLERATGKRLEWQADYALVDWSAASGGALFHRLGGAMNVAVGHAQMDGGTALWDVTLGVGAGVQMIHFDDRVSLVRPDVAIALGLRQIFDLTNNRWSKNGHTWYGLSADVRLLLSPTPDGLDAGLLVSFGMTLGR